MQKFNKILAPAFLGLGMSLIFSVSSLANIEGWKVENGTWKYYKDYKALKFWQKLGNNHYFFNDDGSLKTGWLKDIDNNWYFLDRNEGFRQGTLLTGWQWIDGYCYYFEPTDPATLGRMYADRTVDGYRINSMGRWVDNNAKEQFDATKGFMGSDQGLSSGKGLIKKGSGGIKRSGSGGNGSGNGRGGSVGRVSSYDGNNDFANSSKTNSDLGSLGGTSDSRNSSDTSTTVGDSNVNGIGSVNSTVNSNNADNNVGYGNIDTGLNSNTESGLDSNSSSPSSDTVTNTNTDQDVHNHDSSANDSTAATSSNAASIPVVPENKQIPDTTENNTKQENDSGEQKENKAYAVKDSLTTAMNNNVVQYTDENGKIKTIIWAKGIKAPKMGEGGDFRKEVTHAGSDIYIDHKAPFILGNSWYDSNKSIAGGNTDIDKNLCFGAASANMLHWWLEQNSSYIDSYIAKEGDITRSQRSLSGLRNSFNNQQDSGIFELFKILFGYNDKGFYSDLLMDLFINGYTPKATGGTNFEDVDMTPDNRGGFFYNAFKEVKLTERTYGGNYEDLSEKLKEILGNEGIIGISYKTFGNSSHIVTLWGAEYDLNGKLTAVYVSDSDDQNEEADESDLGMKRLEVRNVGGIAKLSTNQSNKASGSAIGYLHVLYLGSEQWQSYLDR
jgi:methyl-accepting chemotaxis protein